MKIPIWLVVVVPPLCPQISIKLGPSPFACLWYCCGCGCG